LPQPKELHHGFHGWARIETHRDTAPIGIVRVKGVGDLPEKTARKTDFCGKDDRDFALNSVDSLFPLSVSLCEIRGFSSWKIREGKIKLKRLQCKVLQDCC
jgi:hypothetical protein